MQYRIIHVKREQNDQKGEKFASDVQLAMNEAYADGYHVKSVVEVQNSGFTVGVLIATERRA